MVEEDGGERREEGDLAHKAERRMVAEYDAGDDSPNNGERPVWTIGSARAPDRWPWLNMGASATGSL